LRPLWPIAVCLSSLCLAGPSSNAVAQTLPDPSCLKSALTDYQQANATVLQHLTSDNQFLSPEDQISLRHFKEQYCLRYAQCIYGTAPESAHVRAYRDAFSECLRDPNLDPQIALPNREDD
jgi:hypothetical protein